MKLNLNGTWNFLLMVHPKAAQLLFRLGGDTLKETTGCPREWNQSLNPGVYSRTFNLAETDLNCDVFIHIGALATLRKISINGESWDLSPPKGT